METDSKSQPMNTQVTVAEIRSLEEEIRKAQLTNDPELLDRLISDELQFSDQRIRVLGEVATVTVKAEEFHGLFRYLRNWARLGGQWQVVSGCVTQLPLDSKLPQ